MAFGDRLNELREKKKLSRPEMAEVLGLPYNTYMNYEAGRSEPKHTLLCQIADYFDVTLDYLLGVSNVARPTVQGPKIKFPILGRVRAGIPVFADEQILYWDEMTGNGSERAKEYFGLMVVGDSMYPKYCDGDVVIVEKAQVANNGVDAIVMVNGDDATLKRFYRFETGSVELRPINPAYKPMVFTAEDVERLPVTVIGIVRELRRKI